MRQIKTYQIITNRVVDILSFSGVGRAAEDAIPTTAGGFTVICDPSSSSTVDEGEIGVVRLDVDASVTLLPEASSGVRSLAAILARVGL